MSTSRFHNISFLIAGIAIGIAIGVFVGSKGRVETPNIEREEAVLGHALQTIPAAPIVPPSPESSRASSDVATAVETPVVSEAIEAGDEEDGVFVRDTSTFWIDERVKWIEKFFALSDADRDAVRNALAASEPTLEGRRQALVDALGAERAGEIARQEDEEDNTLVQNEIDRRTFSMSRNLNLTREQETRLRTALQETHEELSAFRERSRVMTEQAMSLHGSDAPDARTKLKDSYAEIKKLNDEADQRRLKLIAEKLAGALSDEQIGEILKSESDQGPT